MPTRKDRRAVLEERSRRTPAFGEDLIVRARFIAPRSRPGLISRPRIDAELARLIDYPLTLVRAEAGYGKTTAVAAFLAQSGLPFLWYSLADGEADPLIYLLHIIHLFRTRHPLAGDQALAILEQAGAAEDTSRPWLLAVDRLANDLLDQLQETTVLVLEDYESTQGPEINAITERLVEHAPPGLHLVITTRSMPSLRGRARWRASRELLEIGREHLAFTAEEASALYARRAARPLAASVAAGLVAETEGWPIALQMLSEGAGQAEGLEHLLSRMPGPADLLFDYLAEEVFLRQPEAVRAFLADTAILRHLEPAACDYVRGNSDSAELLAYLETHSVFLVREGQYRYHRLFRDFLLRRSGTAPRQWAALHARAAAYFRQSGDNAAAIHHLLAAGDHASAAELLTTVARAMAHHGRHQALCAWLSQLPPVLLDAHPDLWLALGHAQRFSSRFESALKSYERARGRFALAGDHYGEARTLRGQALVYLDTVQPARAEPLLRLALRKAGRSDNDLRVGLLSLLAENKLNAGNLRLAERMYRRLARITGRETADPRLYVRDGRLALGRQFVESGLRAEATDPATWAARAPRSHREAAALLAWIDAMTGEADSARAFAEQSLEVGRTLGAPIVECISLARLGHAWLAGFDANPAQARAFYEQSRLLAERIGVPRFKVEALLGLALVAALDRKMSQAEACAQEALTILSAAGDQYMKAIVTLCLGAAQVLCDQRGAVARLTEAARLAAQCGDRLAPCLAQSWLAVHYDRRGRHEQAQAAVKRALQAAEDNGYAFIFTRVPLLGPKMQAGRRGLLNTLVKASSTVRTSYMSQLVRAAGGPTANSLEAVRASEPAPLYIQALGRFRVWQAGREIERSAWGREKALHLLQYLVCHHGQRVAREQIVDALWPQTAASAGTTGLRVALNALRRTLGAGDFIGREGSQLWLQRSAGIACDLFDFTRLVQAAREAEAEDVQRAIQLREAALALYLGDLLEDNPYAEWASPERARLQSAYVAAAERLSEALLALGQPQRAADWAQAILARDPLWEEAYGLLMEAYWRQGHRALAVRTYERCRRQLAEGLNVAPSPATRALYARIVSG
jgi:LuxR family transcriptional regulator, maltose regulon positive regulatory protein